MTGEANFYESYKELFNGELHDEVRGYVSKEEGNYDLLAQTFEEIGDRLGALANHPGTDNVDTTCRYFTDSLLNYQYSMQVRDRFVADASGASKNHEISVKIGELYQKFQAFINPAGVAGIPQEDLLGRISHGEEIEALRVEAKARLEKVQSFDIARVDYKKVYVEKSTECFESITIAMRQYLATISKDAETFCGPAPCKYSVIGLGSMAIKQITPYSDLEFAILVSEDNPVVQEYFLKFGHYINFAVTALGESIIPYSTYDTNLDNIVRKAVNLDLGGKTSLGRIGKDKDYKLVCTVDEMVRNLTGEHNEAVKEVDEKRVDSKLPFALTTVCHVCGDKGLSRTYQDKAQEYLNSPDEIAGSSLTKGQQRAIEVLSEEDVGRKANLEEFKFQSIGKEGHLFDVKQEIYRVPDRMLYNLGLIYKVRQGKQGLSAFEVLDSLVKAHGLTDEGALNLKFAASYANILRLRAYDFYGEQKESMNPLPGVAGVEYSNFRIGRGEIEFGEGLKPDGALLQYYYTTLPLMEDLNRLCEFAKEKGNIEGGFFRENLFYGSSNRNKSDICFRLMRYEEVIKYELEFLKEPQTEEGITKKISNIIGSFNIMGFESMRKGQYDIALKYFKTCSGIVGHNLGKEHEKTAHTYLNVGIAYKYLNQHDEALRYYQKTLEICRKIFKEGSELTATAYNNTGSLFCALSKYEKALFHHNEALRIRKKLLGYEHYELAASYNNIATLYGSIGRDENALEMLKRSNTILLKTLGEQHPYAITSYGNISFTLKKLGRFKESADFKSKQWKAAASSAKKKSEEYERYTSELIKIGECLRNELFEAKKFFKEAQALEDATPKKAKKKYEAALEIFQKQHQEKDVKATLEALVKICEESPYKARVEEYREELQSLKTKKSKEQYSREEELESAVGAAVDEEVQSERIITQFKEVPTKSPEHTRIVSYNIAADYFDGKDQTPDQRHHWENRKTHIHKLLSVLAPDIMCLQELSPEQAFDLAEYFKGFTSLFLAQTPSDLPVGAIVSETGVKDWAGKKAGTPLVGTFVRKVYVISETGRFWLNENPDTVPIEVDRGKTDKGFGNMNTYRAVLWCKVIIEGDKELFVFNSHYPLSGENVAREQCAKLERAKIHEIVGDDNWVSAGDRNIIPTARDDDVHNKESVYRELTRDAFDIRNHEPENHYGNSTTWLGFSYDGHKGNINSEDLGDTSALEGILDVMVSNMQAQSSFYHPGGYDLSRDEGNQLISLSEYSAEIIALLNEHRYFASDHALIGADFVLWSVPT